MSRQQFSPCNDVNDVANKILSGIFAEQCECGQYMKCDDINNDGGPDWRCEKCEEEE